MKSLKVSNKYSAYVTFLIYSLISVFFLELTYFKFNFNETFVWMFGNIYIVVASTITVMAFMVFIYAICRHKGVAIFIPMMVAIAYGIASYIKMIYRGIPVLPYEIYMVFSLEDIVSYVNDSEKTFIMVALGIGLAVFIMLLIFIKRDKLSKKIRLTNLIVSGYFIVLLSNINLQNPILYFILNIGFVCTIIYIIFKTIEKKQYRIILSVVLVITIIPYYNKNIVDKIITFKSQYKYGHFAYENFGTDGVIPAYLSYANFDIMDEPENYSKENIEAIVKKYSDISSSENAVRTDIATVNPNVIYIMNETFSDPRNVDGISINKNPLQNYDELVKQYSSGSTIANGYGGGTNISEFEPLTGISSAFLKNQIVFNNIHDRINFPSISSMLGNVGYDTTALHFNVSTMYDRKNGYKNIGIDYYYSYDDILETEYYDNNIYRANDESNYKQIIKMLEAYGKPTFIHNVTIQNHGPYFFEITDNEYEVESLHNKDKEIEAQTYFKEIEHSDEVLKDFLDELDAFPEPTIVVFWGDHLPYFYDDEDFGKDIMDKYETPFMIYSNFGEIEDQDLGKVSMNYLPNIMFNLYNFQKPAYYYMLDDMQKTSSITHFQYDIEKPTNTFAKYKKGASIDPEIKQIYEDYNMILYDITSGENYSVEMGFFDLHSLSLK